jgi:hypothetical protein
MLDLCMRSGSGLTLLRLHLGLEGSCSRREGRLTVGSNSNSSSWRSSSNWSTLVLQHLVAASGWLFSHGSVAVRLSLAVFFPPVTRPAPLIVDTAREGDVADLAEYVKLVLEVRVPGEHHVGVQALAVEAAGAAVARTTVTVHLVLTL